MLPETPEQMIEANDVRSLLAKGFYSSAANVSAKLLYAFEQGYGRVGHATKHTPQSLTLWMYRISALTMLGQVDLAAKELEAFGDLDNPDLYSEYYKHPTPSEQGKCQNTDKQEEIHWNFDEFWWIMMN